jgi:hypothetical protein
MADTKISGMTAASALTGAEVLPVVQSAANVKATAQQVVDAAMTTGLTRQALGSINTNTTIDWSVGSYVTATIGGALTFTFSNPAPTGNACVAYLQLTNGGSAVITWPVSVTWSGGTAPTLRASGVDLLRFYTQDNGTTWFGTAENDESNVAGSDTQVLFNDAGSLAGDSGFTFNKTNNTIDLGGATVTASDPVIDASQTWNNAAVTFYGQAFNVTNTASASGSLLAYWQVPATYSGCAMRPDGRFLSYSGAAPSSGTSFGQSGGTSFLVTAGITNILAVSTGGALLPVTSVYGWSSTSSADGIGDLYIRRDAAGTLAQRDGTNAQTFRVYNTYTDASNYERGKFEWASNELRIGTEKAGTGSARAVAIQADGVTAISIGTSQIVSIAALNINGAYGLRGNGSNPLYNFRHSPAATTLTSYTLTAGDSGVFYIANSGSDQTFTMPASPSAGTWYGFKVSASKSSYLRFTANTGQKIRLAGGLSASAGYVRSNTGGSFVYLMYDSTDAEWVAWQQGGTWTIDS